jgi:hypothetical protein
MWRRPGCRIGHNKGLLADNPHLIVREIEGRDINILPEANEAALGVEFSISDVADNSPGLLPRGNVAMIHVCGRDQEQSPANIQKEGGTVSDPWTQDAPSRPTEDCDVACGPHVHALPKRSSQDRDAFLARKSIEPRARDPLGHGSRLPFFAVDQVQNVLVGIHPHSRAVSGHEKWRFGKIFQLTTVSQFEYFLSRKIAIRRADLYNL